MKKEYADQPCQHCAGTNLLILNDKEGKCTFCGNVSDLIVKPRHTPGKWALVSHYRKANDLFIHVSGPSGGPVIEFAKGWDEMTPTEQANAQRIVKAVNMHDEFIRVIKFAIENINRGDDGSAALDLQRVLNQASE